MNPVRNARVQDATATKSRRVKIMLRCSGREKNLVNITNGEIPSRISVFNSTTVCLASHTHQAFHAGLENNTPVINPITAKTAATMAAVSIHGNLVVAF